MVKGKMRILVAYDGSDHARVARADLVRGVFRVRVRP